MNAQERRKAAMEVLSGCWVSFPHKQFVGCKYPKAYNRRDKHLNGAIWSQCGKKMAYASNRQAKRIADQIRKERGDVLRVYQCPHCGQFHLSKMFRHSEDIQG